jgi:glutathione synthase/RimK-type ligase-like ATP-grasp enzyme
MAEESAESQVTTDHQEIQRWVEERGGRPARVKGTESKQGAGLLRIDYPGFSGEDTLEIISWDEFFEAFEDNNLAFLYQEEKKDGSESRFSKLIDRDSVEEKSKAAGQ